VGEGIGGVRLRAFVDRNGWDRARRGGNQGLVLSTAILGEGLIFNPQGSPERTGEPRFASVLRFQAWVNDDALDEDGSAEHKSVVHVPTSPDPSVPKTTTLNLTPPTPRSYPPTPTSPTPGIRPIPKTRKGKCLFVRLQSKAVRRLSVHPSVLVAVTCRVVIRSEVMRSVDLVLSAFIRWRFEALTPSNGRRNHVCTGQFRYLQDVTRLQLT